MQMFHYKMDTPQCSGRFCTILDLFIATGRHESGTAGIQCDNQFTWTIGAIHSDGATTLIVVVL